MKFSHKEATDRRNAAMTLMYAIRGYESEIFKFISPDPDIPLQDYDPNYELKIKKAYKALQPFLT